MYLDTHNGPVEVSLTGNEATAPVSGVRYVEVSGWLKEPIFVDVSRLSDSPDFSQRAMQRRA